MPRDDGLLKYPRTPHLEGSRLQPGDSTDGQVPYSSIVGKNMVAEEKVDGANCGVSFDPSATLKLQSRGHFLTGGGREKHFNMFKQWAECHAQSMHDVLGQRYIMFAEWMFAKHSVFYDALPHLVLEFDVFDREKEIFLSTPRRAQLLAPLPIVSVPVLYQGPAPARRADVERLVGLSVGRTDDWQASLRTEAVRRNQDPDRVAQQTDGDLRSEGLYIKLEDADQVLQRFKFIRASFTQTIIDTDEHWLNRPIIPNGLRPGTDIFAPTIDKSWPAFRAYAPKTKKPR